LGQIPTKYRFWISLGVLTALLIALPVTLVGLMTGTFELRKRAVSGEPTPIPSFCEAVSGVIDVTPVGSGSCHDIQTAIDVAQENEEIHVHTGTYMVPIHQVNDGRVGLYINKKIFFESDPNTNIWISNADVGILVEGVDVSISGWRVNFRDIGMSGILVNGNSSDRYVYLGVLELYAESSVPRLIDIRGLNGVPSSGGGSSKISECKLWGAEFVAIELGGVNNFEIKENRISHSPVGIKSYNYGNDLVGINIERNTVDHVRAGMVFETDNAYRVVGTYFRDNTLYDFGFDEYYQDEAEKYSMNALGGIILSYGKGVNIISNTLRDGKAIGVFLSGGEENMVERNLIINNEVSLNMSGGEASFIHNTIYGNVDRNGGGASITKGSSFVNNIVVNVGNYHEPFSTTTTCGLILHNGGCADFNDPEISRNDFWNNERIFCTHSEQCSFTYGVNGNIAADPLFGEDYCLLPGSPGIYGDVSKDEYMGHKGLCGLQPITPGPGMCGQSCGPDAACAPGLMCGTPCPPRQACAQYMRCYNPSCPYDRDCICGATPTVIPCGQEGETVPVYPGYKCCPGLEPISTAHPDGNGNCPDYIPLGASMCVKDCGDGQCTLGENKCNCAEDCGPTSCIKEGEVGVEANNDFCCSGLESIGNAQPEPENLGLCRLAMGRFVCVKDCGDGQCTLGENKCNCPEDCGPISTPTPTPTIPTSLDLKIRFDGVTSRPTDDSDREIKIYATNLSGGPHFGSADNKQTVVLSVDDLGTYHGKITFSSDHFGHRYRLRIKGPKHLQRVFPDIVFVQDLDLTDWPLRPGDLDQDGDVDINDLRAIKVFSTNPADIAFGDLNFDNRVDIFDKVLVLGTLAVQYDPD